MFQSVTSFFSKPQPKSGPIIPERPASFAPAASRGPANNGMSFTKIFRWRLPDGHTEAPALVEVAGSFSHWQKIPMTRDSALDSWHAIVHHIPGNRTHHYMIFVDGKPVNDKHCDGLAIPHGPAEEHNAFPTPRGPRVFMLFGQTK